MLTWYLVQGISYLATEHLLGKSDHLFGIFGPGRGGGTLFGIRPCLLPREVSSENLGCVVNARPSGVAENGDAGAGFGQDLVGPFAVPDTTYAEHNQSTIMQLVAVLQQREMVKARLQETSDPEEQQQLADTVMALEQDVGNHQSELLHSGLCMGQRQRAM